MTEPERQYAPRVDIRELSRSDEPSETNDTDTLQAMCKLVSATPTKNVAQIVEFREPRRYDTALPLYISGNAGSGMAIDGFLGSAWGPVGTWIRYVGDPRATLLHTQGLCQSSFNEINWDGNGRARFMHHGEWYPENGCGSSGVHFNRNNFYNFGYHGVGTIVGDQGEWDIKVDSVKGEFQVGEGLYSADQHFNIQEGVCFIKAICGNKLTLHRQFGHIGHEGWKVVGCESLAEGVLTWKSAHRGPIGHQYSEAHWRQCHWHGYAGDGPQSWGAPQPKFLGNPRASWAAWASLCPSNTKNFVFEGTTSFIGVKYGIDWYNASGYLNIEAVQGGYIGKDGYGALFRVGMGGSINARGVAIESMSKCRLGVCINGRMKIDTGYAACTLPDDRFLWIGSGGWTDMDFYHPDENGRAVEPWFMVGNGFHAKRTLIQAHNPDMKGLQLFDGSLNRIGGQEGTNEDIAKLYDIECTQNWFIDQETGIHGKYPNIRR